MQINSIPPSSAGTTAATEVRESDPARLSVILISSVRPEPTYAAAVVLYRLLIGNPAVDLTVLPAEHHEIQGGMLGKLLPYLSRTIARKWAADLRFLVHRFIGVHRNLQPPSKNRRVVVLTMAHEHGCWTAWNYACLHGLPLVVRFDDWLPDMFPGHTFVRMLLLREYRRLYRVADVSICISAGMRDALGENRSAVVILPTAAAIDSQVAPPPPAPPFRVCYLGNMSDYGPMLAPLAREALDLTDIRIEFRGPEPQWPEELKLQMRDRGLLHGFGSGPEFERWFSSFHAYLVVMFFDQEQSRRVQTCFATKLVEYSRIGRAIVIWAPENSEVVRWARDHEAALCVTDPSAEALVRELRRLNATPSQQSRLGKTARLMSETEFDPLESRRAFNAALDNAAETQRLDRFERGEGVTAGGSS